ncbi:MAG TPA: hypothetical protein VM925_32680, partial [Labilithrix sp.]|nr:hypothetical protein [Labilithrix sp.]
EKKLTVVDGGPQRPCKVAIDDLQELQLKSSRTKVFRHVVGHVEAEVGPRGDAAAPTKTIRATFAVSVVEESGR